MNKELLKTIRPVLLIFIFLNALLLSFENQLTKNGIEQTVLILGNLVIFLATLFSMLISIRGIRSSNAQASVRSMYLSFIVKFFLIMIAAFAYIMTVKKEVNKPGLIACGVLYILYTIIEARSLTKLLRKRKHA